jgi:hypothetical protein
MKKLIIIILAFLFILPSCGKKKYHTIVQGKCIDAGSKQPVEGVMIVLQDGVDASGPFHVDGKTSSDKKNIAYTDANGQFTVELKGEHLAALSAKKEGYTTYKEGYSEGEIILYGDGVYENEVIEMRAEAFFEGYFKNTTPNDLDTLFVKTFYFNSSTIDRNRVFIKEEISQFVVPYRGVGNSFYKFQLEFKRNDQWNTKLDSVFLKPFETNRDTIYY